MDKINKIKEEYGIGIGDKKKERRAKNQKKEVVIKKEQSKFFVDVSEEKEIRDLIFSILEKANKKEHGREITFKDLCLLALPKITDKDIERLQESSLSEMEKVNRALNEFNQKNSTALTLGEFLVKRLGIN